MSNEPPQVPAIDRSEEVLARLRPLRERLAELGAVALWIVSKGGGAEVEGWRTDTSAYVVETFADGRWRIFEWLGDSTGDLGGVVRAMMK